MKTNREMKKKVCVIGAGPSGLVMLKELLETGIDAICYESYNSIGGAFRSIEDGGRSYDSLKLTVSNYFMAYSDFMPDPGEDRLYWTVSQYREYLMDYVNHFNLERHIHLSHEVISSKLNGDQVKVELVNGSRQFVETFDHLIICTGSNFIPRRPQLMDEERFKGQIYHSSQYVNANEFKGKSVICVGLAESGADIVHEIGQVADNCQVLVRDYPNVVPRWINGHTNDAYTSTLLYALKKKGIDSYMKLKAWYYLRFNKKLDGSGRLIQKWVSERKSFMGKFLTKTDVFVKDIVEGRVKMIKGTPVKFSQTGLITDKNEHIDAEVIMLNTGYKTCFKEYDFGSSFENPRKLYKHMIHPDFGDRIALIGWARPSQGGLPACSEMQARYMAQLLVGKSSLPDKEKMAQTIKADKNYYESFFEDSVYIKSLICYYKFMNDMGKLLGCRPKTIHLNDWVLTKKLIFGSHISAIYRLNEKTDSINIIKSLPIVYTRRRTAVLLLFSILFYPFYLRNGV